MELNWSHVWGNSTDNRSIKIEKGNVCVCFCVFNNTNNS